MKLRARSVVTAGALALAAWAGSAPAQARGSIALTFDDLPELSLVDNQDYNDRTARDLIAALKRNRLKATGFAVAGKLVDGVPARQVAILDRWLDAGLDLGNHSYSHESPNQLGAAAYIADIARADAVLKPLLARHHRRLRWYRHPDLETGSPAPTRQAIDRWLAGHHYRIAPVTLVTSDYMFAEPYDMALAHGDIAHARALRRAWLSYLRRSIDWYRGAARGLFGRDIPLVMLLHGTRLNADTIDDIAAILRAGKLKVVSLDRAMHDPAYRTRDGYTGKEGIDWIERWSRTLGKPLPWDSFREPPEAIAAEYRRVDDEAARGDEESAPAAPDDPLAMLSPAGR